MSLLTLEIERLISDGERVSVVELTQEFYPESNFVEARGRVYSAIKTVKRRLAQEGIPFCAVAPGIFAIPSSREDIEYGMDIYRKRVESGLNSALVLHSFAKKKNILPSGFKNKTIMLPVMRKYG